MVHIAQGQQGRILDLLSTSYTEKRQGATIFKRQPNMSNSSILKPDFLDNVFLLDSSMGTPLKFNSLPLNSYLPNRKVVFQPPFFRGYVKLREGKFDCIFHPPNTWNVCQVIWAWGFSYSTRVTSQCWINKKHLQALGEALGGHEANDEVTNW